jgi:hypothetical protein
MSEAELQAREARLFDTKQMYASVENSRVIFLVLVTGEAHASARDERIHERHSLARLADSEDSRLLPP